MSTMTFAGVHWGATQNLIYFPVLVICIILLVYAVIRRRRVIALLVASRWSDMLMHAASPARSVFKMVLMIAGCCALFLALLQPQWDKKEEIIEQEGRDLFIALDISRSMLAQDISPDRLAFAKRKIKTLLKKLSCERVGLILFSGSTFVQCPLTTDYGAFHLFLDQIDVETISSGSTAIDEAIKQALDAFGRGVHRKHKLLVLFTDGEDFSSNLAQLKQALIRIHTPPRIPKPIHKPLRRQMDYRQPCCLVKQGLHKSRPFRQPCRMFLIRPMLLCNIKFLIRTISKPL